MIDNLTLLLPFEPPNQFYNSNGKPFEYNGLLYCPKYTKGQIQHYEAELKNLKLFMYPDTIYLSNSLHKFFHGCNYNDFHLSELKSAVEKINSETGIDWGIGRVKKIEYGCNISTNAGMIVNSLLSYKDKDYMSMIGKGFKYGVVSGFYDYKIKGYDKTFEVKQHNKIDLKMPLFRWEISINRMRNFERNINGIPLMLNELLRKEILNKLAMDAVFKYQNSIKMQNLHLNKISANDKKIVAVMLNPEIRHEFKVHHKSVYKKYKRIFRRIMTNNDLLVNDCIDQELTKKFQELLIE